MLIDTCPKKKKKQHAYLRAEKMSGAKTMREDVQTSCTVSVFIYMSY